MHRPQILATKSHRISPWVTLQERSILWSKSDFPETYHSISQSDYVSVLAVTADGLVPLVRQYRPAIQDFTLELPGGIAEYGEQPSVTAERELHEETGYLLSSPLLELGSLAPDVGRLENRLWGYLALDVHHDPLWQPESKIIPILNKIDTFKASVIDGSFDNALHVALVSLALLRGLI